MVATFESFRQTPLEFGWTPSSEQHDRAVHRFASAIRFALTVEVPGTWQQSNDWLTNEETAEMPSAVFEELVAECGHALRLRRLRNQSGAHPFANPDPVILQKLFTLYQESVVGSNLAVIGGMKRLTAVAVGHVQDMLERVKKQLGKIDMVHVPVVDLGQSSD